MKPATHLTRSRTPLAAVGLLLLLALALLSPGLSAQTQSVKNGWLTDEQLGFKVKPPAKWRQIPTQPEEQWIVGLFQSNRVYTNREGYTQKFMMRVIMFDNSPRKQAQTGEPEEEDNFSEDGTITVRYNRKLRYRNYPEYVKQTLGGGGFFFTVEKERGGSSPGMIYEVKVDKLAHVKRHLVAWVYERGNVSFAVEFDVHEEQFKKLSSTFKKTFKSFKLTEVEDPESGSRQGGPEEIKITDLEEWRKLSQEDRQRRRIADEEDQHAKIRAKLPEDWLVTETDNFLLISHASPKFTKKIVEVGDACWNYLEDRFGELSDEHVRRGIIRICRDYDEYRAYYTSSGDFFSFSFGSEVQEMQFYEGELIRDQWGYMMQNLFEHFISDKDSELLDEAPYWLRRGLRGYLRSCEIKGRKVKFPLSISGRVAMSKLRTNGGFAKEQMKTPREIMALTRKSYGELREADLEPYYQCANLVRFIEGPGRKYKLFKGRDFLVEYCRAGVAAAEEYEKNNPDKAESFKEAATEEEEEAQAAEREKRAEEWAGRSEARNRTLLDLIHKRACDWSDDDWQGFAKAYARTCKK